MDQEQCLAEDFHTDSDVIASRPASPHFGPAFRAGDLKHQPGDYRSILDLSRPPGPLRGVSPTPNIRDSNVSSATSCFCLGLPSNPGQTLALLWIQAARAAPSAWGAAPCGA